LRTAYMDFYEKEVIPAMMNKFKYKNVMQIPKIEKIVVNVGIGEAIQNIKVLETASADIKAITGQRPVITKAKKSIGRDAHWVQSDDQRRKNV